MNQHLPYSFLYKIINKCLIMNWDSLVAQLVRNPPAMQETPVQLLGQDDPLEKGQITHSSITPVFLGFPGGSAGEESACNGGDLGSIPGLERSPGEGNSYPLQYSGLENSTDYIQPMELQRALGTKQQQQQTPGRQVLHCLAHHFMSGSQDGAWHQGDAQ